MAFTARSLALALTLLLVLAGQSATVSAAERSRDERSWSERQVGSLVVRYVGPDQAEFAWYADVADQSYREIADVFSVALRESGVEPRAGIVITLYGDDAVYAEENPAAAREEGILGHANPVAGQIGIGVARMRERSEATRRDALRHELTHIILGDLSSQRLPIGFQEGIAQYLERDPEQRQRFAATLDRAKSASQLLRFADLNRQRPFLNRASVAYPESYAMVVYLAERYGFGQVIRLVQSTRDAATLDDATTRTFERSLSDLETEWVAFMPGFVDGGWARNDLDLWDLAEPRRLLAGGRYAEARDGYERAERLFAGMSRADRVEVARAERDRAQTGIDAIDLTRNGTAALTVHDYETAASLLGQAQQRWQDLGEGQRSSQTASGAAQARTGIEAVAQLDEARRRLDGWNFQEADDLAFAAGETLADLGDSTRTEEARQVMADAQLLRTRLGLAAVGGGAAGVAAVGVAWMIGARRRARPVVVRPNVAAVGPAVGQDWSL